MAEFTITWLGQSGFVIRSPQGAVACDLYLSDYCKERSKLDHTRLMPIPVMPEKLTGVDIYLATHAHVDHFDPETVAPILRANPSMRILCPPSVRAVADSFFPNGKENFETIHSGVEIKLAQNLRLIALPAAHEELEKDEAGEYVAFSYLLLFDFHKKAIFVAGDTIPYIGQSGKIREFIPAGYELIMVLPVNGRDEPRAKLGFKGNLTLEEAFALFKECDGALFIPCHFGMFALNDSKEPIDAELFDRHACRGVVPAIGVPIPL